MVQLPEGGCEALHPVALANPPGQEVVKAAAVLLKGRSHQAAQALLR